MKDFFDLLRKQSGGNVQEDCRTTDLEFNEGGFIFAMLMEDDGERLLELLAHGEWEVVARMGLCTFQDDGRKVLIPRWNNFLSHLRIVADVFDR